MRKKNNQKNQIEKNNGKNQTKNNYLYQNHCFFNHEPFSKNIKYVLDIKEDIFKLLDEHCDFIRTLMKIDCQIYTKNSKSILKFKSQELGYIFKPRI